MRLVTANRVFLLKGRVLRYYISSIENDVLKYQSAIAFDEDFTILPSYTEVGEIYEGVQVELTEI